MNTATATRSPHGRRAFLKCLKAASLRSQPFDGTCNPDNPNHWFKGKISWTATRTYSKQEYTIDDNTFLTDGVRSQHQS